MLQRAKQRGFTPHYVLMGAWYSSINNLKFITKKLKWNFICNLKSNRQVSMSQGTSLSLADLDLVEKQVRKVWLKEYGFIVVCKIVHTNGDIIYLASSDLTLTDYDTFTEHFHQRWKIEEFHRGIKQTTGIEKRYSTLATSQLTHILASFLAFLKLEIRRIKEHISWYEQKASLTRFSVTHYLLVNA
ncbi:MAG: hypothetical protein JETT_3869 [Candidatus Jettenia ecosi]|uniref:Transposase IS4-like domain-containing protein n=1 Tax=Candidatus Jettenia ecosi TaxID=2494326 RepID=A0A533Q5P6_9BACT|nr:MAG: hypothetical protein JETT_3869 [Candidatus Jettenia ecosi]